MRLNSLIVKITVMLTAVVVSLMAINAMSEIRKSTEQLQTNARKLHEVLLTGALPTLSKSLWDVSKDSAATSLQSMFDHGEVEKVVLYDDQGKMFAGYTRGTSPTGEIKPEEITTAEDLATVNSALATSSDVAEGEMAKAMLDTLKLAPVGAPNEGRYSLEAKVYAADGTALKKVGYLVLNYSSSQVRAYIEQMKASVLKFAAAFTCALIALTFLFLQFSVIRPIKRIAKASITVASGKFAHVEGVSSGDEIGTLAHNFNSMVDEIQQNTKNLTQLVDQGRAISSQVKLVLLSKTVDSACHAFGGEDTKSTIRYAGACFFGEAAREDFFEIDTNGNLIPGSNLNAAAVTSRSDLTLQVLDPRDGSCVAMLGLSNKDVRVLEKMKAPLMALCNNVASAVTTVRLEQTFGALEIRTREIRDIFDNVQQGICMIDSDLRFGPEYSKCLESLVETTELSGRSVVDVLLARTSLPQDAVSLVHTCVQAASGESILAFECNSHVLPREVEFHSSKGSRFYELDWVPMLDANEEIRNFMLTLRDVTVLRQLRAAAERNRKEMVRIGEILAIPPERFNSFVSLCRSQIETCEKLLRVVPETNPPPQGVQAEIKRELHTIKGNARSFGLTEVVEVTHEVENVFIEAWKSSGPSIRTSELLDQLGGVRAVVDSYEKTCLEKLRRDPGADEDRRSALSYALDLTDRLLGNNTKAKGSTGTDRQMITLRNTLLTLQYPTVSRVIKQVGSSLGDLAKELGRSTPHVFLEGDLDAAVSTDVSETLSSALTHLMRNSLDHGFPAGHQGVISVSLEEPSPTASSVRIFYSDNGRGLNIAKLRTLSGDANASDLAAAEVIFRSGVSTTDKVTQISGRGVGMDAVRAVFEGLGGGLSIEFTHPADALGFRKFRLACTVPREKFLAIIENHVPSSLSTGHGFEAA